MNGVPQRVSEAVRRRNPHLYGGAPAPSPAPPPPIAAAGTARRVRQRTKPAMNKTEARFRAVLAGRSDVLHLRDHAKTYVLANGVRYTPDFTAILQIGAVPFEAAWEVKGPRAWEDALVKMKVAPTAWPEVRWFLAWEGPGGEWITQEILP